MRHAFVVEPARPEEWAEAFDLLFRHLPAADRQTRVAHAMQLTRSEQLVRAGLLVVRGSGALLGALLCTPTAGAIALIWPPCAVEGERQRAVEDMLVQAAVAWLRKRGAKLGQALLWPQEAQLALPLVRNGFVHVTRLWYLYHHLNLPRQSPGRSPRLVYRSGLADCFDVLKQTLLRTYEQTLDCPEINDVRSGDEVIAGLRSQGRHDPARWWLAEAEGAPVGVLLLTEPADALGWEVSYVGVVPEARRLGFGRELMVKALREAQAAQAAQLTLAVDARNQPAWKLYTDLGFEAYDHREVYLAIWR